LKYSNLLIYIREFDDPSKHPGDWNLSGRSGRFVSVFEYLQVIASNTFVCCFLNLQKKARVAFSDQEGRNELLGGEDSHSSEDQVDFTQTTMQLSFSTVDLQ